MEIGGKDKEETDALCYLRKLDTLTNRSDPSSAVN